MKSCTESNRFQDLCFQFKKALESFCLKEWHLVWSFQSGNVYQSFWCLRGISCLVSSFFVPVQETQQPSWRFWVVMRLKNWYSSFIYSCEGAVVLWKLRMFNVLRTIQLCLRAPCPPNGSVVIPTASTQPSNSTLASPTVFRLAAMNGSYNMSFKVT